MTPDNSESARGRLRSARLVRWSSQKAASATCEQARADKIHKSEAGGGRGTVLVRWRGCYPSKAHPQPSEALQEQLLGASRAGQALSCANARPLRLAASQRAFFPRPPAISRRNMTNAGGSAKERLIFMAMAAGAATSPARGSAVSMARVFRGCNRELLHGVAAAGAGGARSPAGSDVQSSGGMGCCFVQQACGTRNACWLRCGCGRLAGGMSVPAS